MKKDEYKILLIEDNFEQAHLMELILHRDSHVFKVDVVHDPEIALQYLANKSYRAIVLDYSLPKLNGLETLEEIKKLQISVPVVMVTGQGDEMIAVEAMRRGVYDYLVKSKDHLETLPRILVRAIEERQLWSRLEQSEQRYFALFDRASIAIFIADSESYKLIQVNKMAEELIGQSSKHLLQHSIFELCSQRTLKYLTQALEKIATEGQASFENVLLKRADGRFFPTDISGSHFTIDGTKVIQFFVRDTSEKIKMQRQLLLSRQRLVSVFDGITDLISVQDNEFNLKMNNKKYSEFTGKSTSELLEKKCYHVLFNRKEPCVGCPAMETYQTGQSKVVELFHKGRTFNISTFAMSGLDGHPDFIVEYIKDITDQKEIEKQLLKSEKLATLGLLSSGIAHEIRNPLNIIETARYSIADTLEDKSADIDKKLEIIKKNVRRASIIINNLLHFSKHSTLEREKIDIEALIDTTTSLVQKEIEIRHIKVEKAYSGVPMVIFSLDSLKQVFLNVIYNAVQAMSNGGTLKIATSLLKESKSVVVEFTDTGVGISEENIKHIFTPFFSTKPAGEGTGLGLYLSYSILKREGADISAKSEQGVGTTFFITLPVSINNLEFRVSKQKKI